MQEQTLSITKFYVCSRWGGGQCKLQFSAALQPLVCVSPHGRKNNTKGHTPLETVYIGCPKQVLVLAGSGDHGDYENIFFIKILLVL